MADKVNTVPLYMDDRTLLQQALGRDDKKEMESLIATGEDVNFMWTDSAAQNIRRCRQGTPICRYLVESAAAEANIDMLQFLLDYGARLDISNALHAAAAAGEDEMKSVMMIHFLLSKGMNVNKLEFADEEDFSKAYTNRAYGTPLHYAAAWGFDKISECLLQNGADSSIEAYCYKSKVYCGTALDWQKANGGLEFDVDIWIRQLASWTIIAKPKSPHLLIVIDNYIDAVQ